jgi:hypothetical protein
MTGRSGMTLDPVAMTCMLNRKLIGWANYFSIGTISDAYHVVDRHTAYRLRQWLRRKHQGRRRPSASTYPDTYLYKVLGLVCLQTRPRHRPYANA